MTFLELVNMTLAEGFSEQKREAAEEWVNAAYLWFWDAEEWSFKTAVANVDVVAGTVTAAVPSDFGIALYLLNADGDPLRPIQDVRQYFAEYGDGEQGEPEAFTIIGSSTLRLGPVPSTGGVYQLVYEKFATPMTSPTGTPLLPSGYHMGIVHKARADGFRQHGIPLADGEMQNAQDVLEQLRQNYLSPVRGEIEQVGAFRPNGV